LAIRFILISLRQKYNAGVALLSEMLVLDYYIIFHWEPFSLLLFPLGIILIFLLLTMHSINGFQFRDYNSDQCVINVCWLNSRNPFMDCSKVTYYLDICLYKYDRWFSSVRWFLRVMYYKKILFKHKISHPRHL